MVFGEICNTRLSLGIGAPTTTKNHLQFNHLPKMESVFCKSDQSFTTLSLGLSSEMTCQAPIKIDANKMPGEFTDLYRQDSLISAVSSFSNSSLKREREISGDNEVEEQKNSSKIMMSDDQDEEGSARKKLRLTKEQSVILEDSFRKHSTLNPRQKEALAIQLNLRPRQIEVWFQNRRARTKLKQTEVDCELLKKFYETLTEENRRLHKELQELRALKLTAPMYMQMPAATLTVCSSCERIAASGQNTINKTPFSIGTKPSHLYNPFSHPSAAPC